MDNSNIFNSIFINYQQQTKMADQSKDTFENQENGQLQQVHHQLPRFIKNNKETFSILFFQCIGMIIFVYGFTCSKYQVPIQHKLKNPLHQVFIACSLFLAMCWCRKFSQGHLNPAVTIAFMIKKDRIETKKGILLIIAQVVGSFIGAFLAWVFFDATAGPYPTNITKTDIFMDVIGEVLATFFFVTFFLIVFCKDTTFISEQHWIYVFIPVSLFICRTFPAKVGTLNPALGFALQVFETVRVGNGHLMQYSLIVILSPIFGAILAVLSFEYFYRVTFKEWKNLSSN